MKKEEVRQELLTAFDRCQNLFDHYYETKQIAYAARCDEENARRAYETAKKEWDELVKKAEPKELSI